MSQNVTPPRHLRPEQRKAIEALATGATIDQAATVAGRTRRTIYRWLSSDIEFQGALQEAASLALTDAARRLASTLDLALSALRETLERPNVRDVDRLRAANLVFSNVLRLTELENFERRLAALEEAVNNAQQNPK